MALMVNLTEDMCSLFSCHCVFCSLVGNLLFYAIHEFNQLIPCFQLFNQDNVFLLISLMWTYLVFSGPKYNSTVDHKFLPRLVRTHKLLHVPCSILQTHQLETTVQGNYIHLETLSLNNIFYIYNKSFS